MENRIKEGRGERRRRRVRRKLKLLEGISSLKDAER
jgi:hypothetical protein